jgi:hypothetical protein
MSFSSTKSSTASRVAARSVVRSLQCATFPYISSLKFYVTADRLRGRNCQCGMIYRDGYRPVFRSAWLDGDSSSGTAVSCFQNT